MEHRIVSGRIPNELEERVRSEMKDLDYTMSCFLEMVINEHFENEKGGKKTMDNKRTLAFAVSEEFFQRVKDYLEWYRETYHRKLTQKEFTIGLIEDELEKNEGNLAAWRAAHAEAQTHTEALEQAQEAAEGDGEDADNDIDTAEQENTDEALDTPANQPAEDSEDGWGADEPISTEGREEDEEGATEDDVQADEEHSDEESGICVWGKDEDDEDAGDEKDPEGLDEETVTDGADAEEMAEQEE